MMRGFLLEFCFWLYGWWWCVTEEKPATASCWSKKVGYHGCYCVGVDNIISHEYTNHCAMSIWGDWFLYWEIDKHNNTERIQNWSRKEDHPIHAPQVESSDTDSSACGRGGLSMLRLQLQLPKPMPPPQQLIFFSPTIKRWASSYNSLISIQPSKSTTHHVKHHQTIPAFTDCCPIPTTLLGWNLSQVTRLHAHLIIGGFFSHSSISTTHTALGWQLVHAYVKFGRLEEALLVFHRLPQRNNKNSTALNAILRDFVNAGQFSEAIDLYRLLLTQTQTQTQPQPNHGMVAPDNYTYPLILKACSGMSALQLGREVLQESIRFMNTTCATPPQPNIYVACAAIDMFAKCGSLDEARILFDDMPSRDLASWTAIICGTLHNGHSLEALRLFRRMRSEDGIRPDSAILAALLPVCGRLELSSAREPQQLGMTLQACAIRSGFEADLYVSNALVDMYCKCGDTANAYRLFSNMVHKDVVSWSILIAGYSQNCQYRRSVELFLEMSSSGITTTVVTAASVLPAFAKLQLLKHGKEMHNYILKQGLESDVVLASALIDMYAKCGAKREACHIFEIMSDKDITIWNSMIAGHASDEDFDSAFSIFRRILWESRLNPNSITLMSILPVCTKMGTVKQGKEIHGYATRSNLGKVVSVGNSLIDMYCKCGYLDLGAKVFHQMLEKDIVTYNTIISAYGIHGQAQQAFSFFEKMKAANVSPNNVTFVGLLSACSHAGLVDSGWSFYGSMTDDYHLRPDMEHYSCMVDLLGRAGELGDAYDFIKMMPIEPDINVFGSLLGACRAHNKVELANLIGTKIFEKNVNDSGYHVLLSNIYASIERWQEASKVRTMMKEKGLIKKPGKSWIQISGWVHTFHARGTTHPMFHKLQETLESLLLEMKKEGYILDLSYISHNLEGIGDELINLHKS